MLHTEDVLHIFMIKNFTNFFIWLDGHDSSPVYPRRKRKRCIFTLKRFHIAASSSGVSIQIIIKIDDAISNDVAMLWFCFDVRYRSSVMQSISDYF